jgi:hypothetical protein
VVEAVEVTVAVCVVLTVLVTVEVAVWVVVTGGILVTELEVVVVVPLFHRLVPCVITGTDPPTMISSAARLPT